MIELHKIGIIDDQMLKHATGIKYYECKGYQKIPGPVAKFFSSNRPGYAYPLFKTHKLTPDALNNVSVFDIPIRLLQSAGNITTSKITAFLEHIFQPISIKFCQFKINEYCRDSKQYLHEVAEWKTTVHNNSNNDNLYIVAGDVKALYPTISRSLVEKALTYVLHHFSHYSKAAVKILVDLALFCLNNVVIQYKEGFFTQSIGIVTGDNHSVSLANITLHYIILPVSEIINQAVLFKRYIDDIIWLSFGVDNTTKIKEALSRVFMENKLELSFRCVNTAELGSCLEFLDVEHKIDNSHIGGFYTRDFVKPTALDRTFLNGKSFHPTHIFKSIVFSEAVRLRRLNETQSDYLASLERLKQKCIHSQFNVKLVSRILDLASKWNDRFGPKQDSGQQKTKPRIIWASSFVNLLKLNSTEKFLVPDAAVVYKKPPTLLNMLTNYRNIAHNESFQRDVRAGLSHPCNKCALCGNFRYYNGKSMVPTVNHIKTAQGKLFFLKQNLTCSNYEIYAAQCKICQKIYVGQTINHFSTRWSGHRAFWSNNNAKKEHNDRASLLIHFQTWHKELMNSLPDISDCFEVTFLQEPRNQQKLDVLESMWINKLVVEININKTILPKYH